MSVRSELTDALAPALPKGWKLIPFQRNVDQLSQPTVMVKLSKIDPIASVGVSPGWKVTATVTLIAPYDDAEKAQSFLDDAAPQLMDILAGLRIATASGARLPVCTVGEATFVQFGDRYDAFDIPITTASSKDN